MKSVKILVLLGLALVGPAAFAAPALAPVSQAARTALSAATGAELSATAATALVNSSQVEALAQQLGVTLSGSSTVRAEMLAKALKDADQKSSAVTNLKTAAEVASQAYSKKAELKDVASIDATLNPLLAQKGIKVASSDVGHDVKGVEQNTEGEPTRAEVETYFNHLLETTGAERVLSPKAIQMNVDNLIQEIGMVVFSNVGLRKCVKTFGPDAKRHHFQLILAAGDIIAAYKAQKIGEKDVGRAILEGTRTYFKEVHSEELAQMQIETDADFDAWLYQVGEASMVEQCVYTPAAAAAIVN